MFGLDFIGNALDDVFTLGQGSKGTDYALGGRQAFQDLKPIGPSAYESADPATRGAQMDALSRFNASNALARAQGLAGVYGTAANAANASANRAFDETGRIMKMIPGMSKPGSGGS